jgi:hypothetical protein
LVPHVAPFVMLVPRSVHTGAPVPQASVPLWQTLLGLQPEPFAHATQAPALQTIPEPQFVPAATFPVCVHTEVPVAHDVVPVRQTFPPGVQGWFGTQDLQLPAEQ